MNYGDPVIPLSEFRTSAPSWLLKLPCAKLSLGAKLTYIRLAEFAGKNGKCNPRQELLAEELGLSDRQISAYLGDLKKAKLIAVKRTGRAASYVFLWHPWCEGTEQADTQDLAIREDARIAEIDVSDTKDCADQIREISRRTWETSQGTISRNDVRTAATRRDEADEVPPVPSNALSKRERQDRAANLLLNDERLNRAKLRWGMDTGPAREQYRDRYALMVDAGLTPTVEGLLEADRLAEAEFREKGNGRRPSVSWWLNCWRDVEAAAAEPPTAVPGPAAGATDYARKAQPRPSPGLLAQQEEDARCKAAWEAEQRLRKEKAAQAAIEGPIMKATAQALGWKDHYELSRAAIHQDPKAVADLPRWRELRGAAIAQAYAAAGVTAPGSAA